MLGVSINNNLKFDNHVSNLCKKVGRKLSALTRLAKILLFHKMRILIKSFFDSQFSYCPLIWMFISRSSNHKINKLHEQSLRILYKDDISSFSKLLQKNNSVSVHTLNIHISPNFIKEIFPTLDSAYNLRQSKDFITLLYSAEMKH